MELGSDILLRLQQYLNDEMDETLRASFESEISNSKDLQEFIALYKGIDSLEDDENWNYHEGDTEELTRVAQLFRDEDTLEFTKKVKQIRANSLEISTKNRKPYKLVTFTLIAASLAAIIFIAFPKETDMSQLYFENSSWNELPSFVVKGDSIDKERLDIEQAFKMANFELVIALSESIMESTNLVDANVYLYNGVAHLELDQFDKALDIFKHLTESNSIDNHKGFWYVALVYLKQENKEKTLESLGRVISFDGNYKYEHALKLLEDMK